MIAFNFKIYYNIYGVSFMDRKICSFFGHRNAKLTDEQYEQLKNIIENLIINNHVQIFLFGSRSNFNFTCHKIVTKLKEKYPFIIRKCYTCKSETCTLESERINLEKIYSHLKSEKVVLLGFEEEVEYKTKYTSGRASYIERNQAMINDSDYCIFYYNDNYQPKTRRNTKQNYIYYQPKSVTKLSYNYAKQKRKFIINLI